MSKSGKELGDLLSRLEKDVKQETDNNVNRPHQPSTAISIVGNNNTFTIGDQYIGLPKSADTTYTNNCKACGHIVAKAAKFCPGCGQPLKVSRFKRHILFSALFLSSLVTSPPHIFGFFH